MPCDVVGSVVSGGFVVCSGVGVGSGSGALGVVGSDDGSRLTCEEVSDGSGVDVDGDSLGVCVVDVDPDRDGGEGGPPGTLVGASRCGGCGTTPVVEVGAGGSPSLVVGDVGWLVLDVDTELRSVDVTVIVGGVASGPSSVPSTTAARPSPPTSPAATSPARTARRLPARGPSSAGGAPRGAAAS